VRLVTNCYTLFTYLSTLCVLCAFSALTLLVGRQQEHPACENWATRCSCLFIGLEQGTDCLHLVQLMPLHPKTPSYVACFKSRLVLPFWYQLTQVVLGKRLLNGCCSGHNSSSSGTVVTACVQLKFLEVSHLSFVAGLGPKLKEGMVEKRAGGRRVAIHCCMCCSACCQPGRWQKRWVCRVLVLAWRPAVARVR